MSLDAVAYLKLTLTVFHRFPTVGPIRKHALGQR